MTAPTPGALRVAAAVVFGLAGGFLLRGDGDEGPAAPTTQVTAAVEATPEREQAALAAEPERTQEPARRGQVATVEFTTRPGSSCQVELSPPGGEAERLPVHVADADGRVAWRWNVDDDLDAGTARAVVVCSGGARADVAIRVV